MTVVRMAVIWDWMAARLADPPPAPKFKVTPFFLPLAAHGVYRNGVLFCKPWASRIIVIHEACHYLWHDRDIQHSAAGGFFLSATHRAWWSGEAIEEWAATLTAILVDKPGVWKKPISGAVPVKEAVWTFGPFLKEKP